MELALGAVASLPPKLLVMMHAALADVSKVPWHKLLEVDKTWARQVRELSYDTEDAIDAFALRAAGHEPAEDDPNIFRKVGRKAIDIMKNLKGRDKITDKVKDIKNLSKELADLCAKYRFNSSGANPTSSKSIDPCVLNLYKTEAELVGIEATRDEVIRRLTDVGLDRSLKIVSIVGFGGLGKTTLAKTVHKKLKAQFDCNAFVPVRRNPSISNVLKKILVERT
ncbi:hypothetical protein ACP4OV_029205 [Aristida adscensionis]